MKKVDAVYILPDLSYISIIKC